MLTPQRLRRLQLRHWRYGNSQAFNAFRSFLAYLEHTIETQRTKEAVERIHENRAKLPKVRKTFDGPRNIEPRDEGRVTAIATDAFDRRHSVTY